MNYIYEIEENDFDCSERHLESLEGVCPRKVSDCFICNNNKLTSLKGAPEYCDSIKAWDNQLTTLEGLPKGITYFMHVCNNKLKSLKGCPQELDGSFDCSYNQLETLEGGPLYIGDSAEYGYLCGGNLLKNLKGGPKEVVEGEFDCRDNYLLEDISDLSPLINNINLSHCNNVKIFTTEIDTEDNCLTIYLDEHDDVLRNNIKQWFNYEVVSESLNYIIVKVLPDNSAFMDKL